MVPTLLRISRRRRRLLQRGQTLVEYSLILAIVVIVTIAVLFTLGQQTKGLFSTVTSQVSRAGSV